MYGALASYLEAANGA